MIGLRAYSLWRAVGADEKAQLSPIGLRLKTAPHLMLYDDSPVNETARGAESGRVMVMD
jgi:hypothetical protein